MKLQTAILSTLTVLIGSTSVGAQEFIDMSGFADLQNVNTPAQTTSKTNTCNSLNVAATERRRLAQQELDESGVLVYSDIARARVLSQSAATNANAAKSLRAQYNTCMGY